MQKVVTERHQKPRGVRPPPLPPVTSPSQQMQHHKLHRRPRRKQSFSLSLLPRMIVAGCCGALAFLALTSGGANVRAFEPIAPSLVEVLRFAGFGIDQVTVRGHRNVSDAEIFSALELERSQTFLGFEISAARKRLEALPWVKTAAIVRRFPGQLQVSVQERVPSAVWQHASATDLFYLDKTGRLLGPVKEPNTTFSLLRLSGAGAVQESMSLFGLVGRAPWLSQDLLVAERVGGRRWALHMKNGAVIHLPAEGVDATLRQPAVQKVIARLQALSNTIIDLRTPGRITMRSRKTHSANAR